MEWVIMNGLARDEIAEREIETLLKEYKNNPQKME